MAQIELNIKDDLTVKDLKKLVLTSKKESKELSQAYGAILKQVEAQTVGVKNPETDEKKLILKACNKELKEQKQAQEAGAPCSTETIMVCTFISNAMSPKLMSERETEVAVDAIITELDNPNMGQIMGKIKQEYKDTIDMAIASKVVKAKLN